ncbi:MAG: RNA polymerase sigma factor [Bacteroidota bacterium]
MTAAEYNQCVDRFADNVFRFLVKNVKDEEKAKDLVQDTFEKLWLRKADVQAEKAKSYLFSTAYHTMIDRLRREKKQGNMEEVRWEALSHERQYSDLQEILHEALDRLPEVQKAVVLLRDYEGYAYQEIGQIMQLSESQVKVYIFRARKFLKQYIGSLDQVL